MINEGLDMRQRRWGDVPPRSSEPETAQLALDFGRKPGRLRSSMLSGRQVAVLHLLAEGADNASIAKRLFYSYGTIKVDVREILEKLGTANRTAAAVLAVRTGII